MNKITDLPSRNEEEAFEQALTTILQRQKKGDRALLVEEIKKIWQQHKYYLIQDRKIQNKLLDLSVSIRPEIAHVLLQRSLKAVGRPVREDGIFSPQTLTATNKAIPSQLLASIKSEAAGYYRAAAVQTDVSSEDLERQLQRAYS